jgi:hypothetical protein
MVYNHNIVDKGWILVVVACISRVKGEVRVNEFRQTDRMYCSPQ